VAAQASDLQRCENGITHLVARDNPPAGGEEPVAQLGANAHGEVLEPGRVADCYLGLRLDPDDAEAVVLRHGSSSSSPSGGAHDGGLFRKRGGGVPFIGSLAFFGRRHQGTPCSLSSSRRIWAANASNARSL
jgi:hypothetical protein